MTELAPVKLTFSDDQAEAYDRVSAELYGMGIDLDNGGLEPAPEGKSSVLAVVGKAGSGKTLLLARLYAKLTGIGVEIISGDYESRRRRERHEKRLAAERAAREGRGDPEDQGDLP